MKYKLIANQIKIIVNATNLSKWGTDVKIWALLKNKMPYTKPRFIR